METPKETKLGQERAFADEWNYGMTKRFYAACAAMQGAMASEVRDTPENIVKGCYIIADELLKQENL